MEARRFLVSNFDLKQYFFKNMRTKVFPILILPSKRKQIDIKDKTIKTEYNSKLGG